MHHVLQYKCRLPVNITCVTETLFCRSCSAGKLYALPIDVLAWSPSVTFTSIPFSLCILAAIYESQMCFIDVVYFFVPYPEVLLVLRSYILLS
jgi:hypothetical protein